MTVSASSQAAPVDPGTSDPEFLPPRPHPSQSVNRMILKAAGSVALAAIVVKVIATAKEILVAARFGRSDAMDAFLIAYLLPGLLVNLFSESMNQALIPTLIRVREQEGRAKAQELMSSSMLGTCVIMLVGASLMALTARIFFPLLLPHFSAAKVQTTTMLFYGLLPVIFLAGIASNCAAVVNTLERFVAPALAPASVPIAIIVAVWLWSRQLGIQSLVYGNLAGGVTQAALMVWMLRAQGFCFRLRWYGSSEALREVGSQYGLVLISGLVASGGLLVDQGMAASLSPGSVATLAYANRFVSVIVTLMAGAVATAITPYFSQLVARREWKRCQHKVNTWVAITAAISIPIAASLILGSHSLIRLAFQHGSFAAEDTTSVARVQTMYALQLPFYVVSRVFYRYLSAIRKSSVILVCGVLNLLLDVVLNIVCMHWYGVAGIALATSLWTIATFLFLGFWTYWFLHQSRIPEREAL